jgi:hypothetical protein
MKTKKVRSLIGPYWLNVTKIKPHKILCGTFCVQTQVLPFGNTAIQNLPIMSSVLLVEILYSTIPVQMHTGSAFLQH